MELSARMRYESICKDNLGLSYNLNPHKKTGFNSCFHSLYSLITKADIQSVDLATEEKSVLGTHKTHQRRMASDSKEGEFGHWQDQAFPGLSVAAPFVSRSCLDSECLYPLPKVS